MDERFLPDWDENALSLGRPRVMNTPTLIEWIQRQLETPEETAQREEQRRQLHEQWHQNNPGIYGCCIKVSQFAVLQGTMTVNQMREVEERMRVSRASGKRVMYLPEGVRYSELPSSKE